MGSQERRQREKEQRRKQVLDAARELLFTRGIGATTISRIAKSAELSVGTIYFYFSSKEEIFAALQEEGLTILRDMIHSASSNGSDPEKKIIAIAQAYLDFSTTHKNYFSVINYFLTSPEVVFPDNLKNRIDTFGNSILSLVEEVIEEGKDTGVFRPGNPRKSAITLWGLIHGLLQFRKLKNTILKNEDFTEVFEDAVQGFISGLKCD